MGRETASCGLAWLSNDPKEDFTAYAFSVVSYSCATGYFSYVHEISHNMGANHHRANAVGDQAVFPYSYGYREPSGVQNNYGLRRRMWRSMSSNRSLLKPKC